MSSKLQIRLSCPASEFIFRQTPGCCGQWGNYKFSLDGGEREFDAWVVYERLNESQEGICDPSRTILVTGEPQSLRSYHPKFLRQFGAILTPRTDINHTCVIRQQPAIPWWAGVTVAYPHKTRFTLDYDRFKSMQAFEKTKNISIITTTKTLTEGHRRRLRFVESLAAHFASRLDVFGHGFTPVADKWDAIAGYRYHIALENSSWRDYWTEKVADAYLGGAYPLYWGCPNLADYFPAGSFRYLDLEDLGKTIDIIETTLANNEYHKSLPHIMAAREAVLDRYNLFAVIADVVGRLPCSSKRKVRLRTEEDYSHPLRKYKKGLKHLLGR